MYGRKVEVTIHPSNDYHETKETGTTKATPLDP